jgi:hypothetical protein
MPAQYVRCPLAMRSLDAAIARAAKELAQLKRAAAAEVGS